MARRSRGRGGSNIRATLAALKKQQEEERKRRLREARELQRERERQARQVGAHAVPYQVRHPSGKWDQGGITYTVNPADDKRAGSGGYYLSMNDPSKPGQEGHGSVLYRADGSVPDAPTNRKWIDVVTDILFE